MTDAERLGINIESLWDIADGLASYSGVKLSDKEVEIVKYFIEQAVRAQELEKENKRYMEALKEIGESTEVGEGYEYADQYANNFIAIARQAIKGEENV